MVGGGVFFGVWFLEKAGGGVNMRCGAGAQPPANT